MKTQENYFHFKIHKKTIGYLVYITTSIFIALSIFFFCTSKDNSFFDEVYAQSPLKDKYKNTSLHELQQAFHDIYELYKDSIVFISTERTVRIENPFYNDPFLRRFFEIPDMPRTQRQTGLGTGFIISSDGYICTNHHVVAGMDKVKVKIKDKFYDAKIVGSDKYIDIALLKIDNVKNLKPVYFGDSDKIKVGDWAIAIGNPFGLDKTFTVGVISAVARTEVDQMGNSHIQTDASINPGNSGGPLINLDGEVIGINRMIYSQTGGSLGIGFAIPINTAKSALEQLKQNGKIKRGYIGIYLQDINEEIAQELNLKEKEGVIITGILERSPAQKAGLQPGDIILEINGQKIKTYKEVIKLISSIPIGTKINVKIKRKNQIINFMIIVEEKKGDDES